MTATTTCKVWRKIADQQVHLRLVHMPGLTTIELRDWNETTRSYGRGIWFADTPAIRDLLARAAHTPDRPPAFGIPEAGPVVLAAIDQAPGSLVNLRRIDVDGIPALEFREHRSGEDRRGYWIPFNAVAEQILLSASAHDTEGRAA